MPRVESGSTAFVVLPLRTEGAPVDVLWNGWRPLYRLDGRSPADRDAAHRANVAIRRGDLRAFEAIPVPFRGGGAQGDDARSVPRPRPTDGAAAPRYPGTTTRGERADMDAMGSDITHVTRTRSARSDRFARGSSGRAAPGRVDLEASCGDLGEPRRAQGRARGLAHGRQAHAGRTARAGASPAAGVGARRRDAARRRARPGEPRRLGRSHRVGRGAPRPRLRAARERRPRGGCLGREADRAERRPGSPRSARRACACSSSIARPPAARCPPPTSGTRSADRGLAARPKGESHEPSSPRRRCLAFRARRLRARSPRRSAPARWSSGPRALPADCSSAAWASGRSPRGTGNLRRGALGPGDGARPRPRAPQVDFGTRISRWPLERRGRRRRSPASSRTPGTRSRSEGCRPLAGGARATPGPTAAGRVLLDRG